MVLPNERITDFLNNERVPAQIGLIYLPQMYVSKIKSIDQLEQAQTLLKIVHIISKQLVKHWFYNYQECDHHIDLSKEAQESDLTTEINFLMRYNCDKYNKNCTNSRNKNIFLKHNQNCFLFKGFTNWLSYLGFQSIKPDLFDLVRIKVYISIIFQVIKYKSFYSDTIGVVFNP